MGTHRGPELALTAAVAVWLSCSPPHEAPPPAAAASAAMTVAPAPPAAEASGGPLAAASASGSLPPIRDDFAHLKFGLRVSVDGDEAASVDERLERGSMVVVRGFKLIIQRVKGGRSSVAEMKAAMRKMVSELPAAKRPAILSVEEVSGSIVMTTVGNHADPAAKTAVATYKEIAGTVYMCWGDVRGLDTDSAFRTTAVRVCTSLEASQ